MHKPSCASPSSSGRLKDMMEGIEPKRGRDGRKYSIVKIGGEDYFVWDPPSFRA